MGHFSPPARKEGKKEKKSSLALSHTLYAESQSRQKSATLLFFATFLFLLFFSFGEGGKCSVRRDLHIGTGKQERSLSLSSSTLTEGRKKVDKPRRIELPSSYSPKNLFFEKYPPPCVSHIRTTKGRIIGLN